MPNRANQVQIDYYSPPAPRSWRHWVVLSLIIVWTCALFLLLPWVFVRMFQSFMTGI